VELVIRPVAEQDLAEAADWYAQLGERLKERFIARVESTLERILSKPSLFPHAKWHLRRASVHEFPYSIYFRVVGDKAVVFAVLHHSRDLRNLDQRLN
jgi:plasmid stabilization system protein ParE